jgi:Protein of unknown function (DUF3710)
VIFSRGRGRARHARDDARPAGRHAAPEDDPAGAGPEPTGRDRGDTGRDGGDTGRDGGDTGRDGGDAGRDGGDTGRDGPGGDAPAAGRAARGPYDIANAPAGVDRIDLGSLKIPAVEGVEVRVQASQDGAVQQVVLVHGGSALQLVVLAAPRTDKIWNEVRAEIRASLAEAQSVQEVRGPYGLELRARVRGPEGPVDLRFIGVDRPRWMVQALFQGPAATDAEAAAPLFACLDGLVVERGREAMPVREPLPLRLPRDIAEQAARAEGAAGPGAAPTAPAPGGVNGRPSPGGTAPDPGGSGRGPRRPSPRPRRTG